MTIGLFWVVGLLAVGILVVVRLVLGSVEVVVGVVLRSCWDFVGGCRGGQCDHWVLLKCSGLFVCSR